MLLFNLAQDLAGCQKILTVTLELAQKTKTFLNPAPGPWGNDFFDLSKAKNLIFPLSNSKNNFVHFRGLKTFKQFLIQIFLLAIVCKKRVFAD